jgi:hypothetical protein
MNPLHGRSNTLHPPNTSVNMWDPCDKKPQVKIGSQHHQNHMPETIQYGNETGLGTR